MKSVFDTNDIRKFMAARGDFKKTTLIEFTSERIRLDEFHEGLNIDTLKEKRKVWKRKLNFHFKKNNLDLVASDAKLLFSEFSVDFTYRSRRAMTPDEKVTEVYKELESSKNFEFEFTPSESHEPGTIELILEETLRKKFVLNSKANTSPILRKLKRFNTFFHAVKYLKSL